MILHSTSGTSNKEVRWEISAQGDLNIKANGKLVAWIDPNGLLSLMVDCWDTNGEEILLITEELPC